MNLQTEIIKTALRKLFTQNHFSICTIRDLNTFVNNIPDRKIMQGLQALHCVSYSEMSDDLRKWVFTSCVRMYNTDFISVMSDGSIVENGVILRTFKN